ncbi:MAG: hypothetical protein IIA66_01720, partial [Planctomycetes bacterium]|nr:hypothetical protein [Planctomycetota bacterium]
MMPALGSPSLAPETANNVLFQEVQRAWDVWFYKLLCAILVVAMMAIGTVCWRHHAPVTAMIMFGIGAGWYWMFAVMALFTEVRKDALYVRFHPFHL